MDRDTKDHLKNFHQASASHHAALGKAHKRLAESHEEQVDADTSGHHAAAASAHWDACKAHLGLAQHHSDSAKTLDSLPSVASESRTNADTFRNAVGRDGSAIAAPADLAKRGLRLVPRDGQPRFDELETTTLEQAAERLPEHLRRALI